MGNIEPTRFGDKYLLVEHIATGGMAEIYRAQYTGIEGFAKELVVKRLREEFAQRSDVVRMFLDEARVAATLTHNNVVHTYDLGELDGEYFIAMELLKGEELVEVLRRSVKTKTFVPLELSLGIVMQSLEGLNYVHGQRDEGGDLLALVHRDINPTNIHVGYDGVCKIVDFGIAATRATALAGSGQFAGKLSYMAPEQIEGLRLDGRADIFAIGVILYEMCLRRRLFRGRPDEVRRRILSGDIPAPTFVDPSFPPALEAVIMKALETDPADRYQNADHMVRDLDAFLHEHGLRWNPRKISAYMAEMFGEGAPAEVNYDDQYDDLVDDALDFDNLDRMPGDDEDDAPEWAKSLQGSGGTNAPKKAMTLGSLEDLVAGMEGTEAGEAEPEASPSKAEKRPATRTSGRHKAITEQDVRGPKSKSGRLRRVPTAGHRSVGRGTGRNPALSPTGTHAALKGTFGHSVVVEQSKGTNPILWVVLTIILGSAAYFAYTILTSK